jgi:hypothetical protein
MLRSLLAAYSLNAFLSSLGRKIVRRTNDRFSCNGIISLLIFKIIPIVFFYVRLHTFSGYATFLFSSGSVPSTFRVEEKKTEELPKNEGGEEF